MKKKLLTLVLALVLCLPSLASCGGVPEKESDSTSQSESVYREDESKSESLNGNESASMTETESSGETDTATEPSSESSEETENSSTPASTETSTERETQKQPASSEASKGLDFVKVGNSYAVVGIGSCPDRNIVIPKEHDGSPVTEISEYAFVGNTYITDIKLPSSITKIGEGAFYGCSNLKNVTLSNNLKSIGDGAFYDCGMMESIRIPESIEELGVSVFDGCDSLTLIHYGSTLHKASAFFEGKINVAPGKVVEIVCADGQRLVMEGYVDIPGEDPETEPDDESSEFFPNVERNNYGDDFNMFFAPTTNVDMFYMDDETNDGSPMDEAVFARQEKVQRYLGIEIVKVSYPDANFSDYNKYVETSVQNKDGTMDALITHVHGGVGALISDNLICDLGELDGIDLEAEYWNLKYMDTLKLKGNYFLGYSDYNILYTYVIAFNKDMLALYDSHMDKSIYDLVKDREWTLNEMISLASLVYIDKTGDGKTADDTYGITGNCWVPFCGFLTSSDIPMLEQDQSGAYKVAINQSQYFERAEALIIRLEELAASTNAYFDYDYSKISVPLTSRRALMQTVSTGALTSMLDYDVEFGVVPYPMFDLEQASVGYKSLQWGGYIGVLSYLQNPIMVGETLELLAFYSENVKITYYEKLLGKQVADIPDDAAMLDIIRDSLTGDMGQTFVTIGGSDQGVCYTVPALMWPSETRDLAPYVKGKEAAINEGFKKFLDGIK